MSSALEMSSRILCVLVLLMLVSSLVVAQSGRSWMKGFVLGDSETDGVSGATVELIGDQSSDSLRSVHIGTKTDERGEYSLTEIPYGDYTFRVSSPGFTTYEIKIHIASDMLTELHVKLRKVRE